MSNSLFWVKGPNEVHQFIPPITSFEFPNAHFAARQVKYYFARLQHLILLTVLNELQEIFESSEGCSRWLIAFVAVLGLAMASEEEQKATHLVQAIKVHTETLHFGENYPQGANVACQCIDARMQFIFQIFRWKYNRRLNPLKDFYLNWAGEYGFGDENSEIIHKVSQLVKGNSKWLARLRYDNNLTDSVIAAFLQMKQQGTVDQANMKNFTSHLVARFLLSFWLP